MYVCARGQKRLSSPSGTGITGGYDVSQCLNTGNQTWALQEGGQCSWLQSQLLHSVFKTTITTKFN